MVVSCQFIIGTHAILSYQVKAQSVLIRTQTEDEKCFLTLFLFLFFQ